MLEGKSLHNTDTIKNYINSLLCPCLKLLLLCAVNTQVPAKKKALNLNWATEIQIQKYLHYKMIA